MKVSYELNREYIVANLFNIKQFLEYFCIDVYPLYRKEEYYPYEIKVVHPARYTMGMEPYMESMNKWLKNIAFDTEQEIMIDALFGRVREQVRTYYKFDSLYNHLRKSDFKTESFVYINDCMTVLNHNIKIKDVSTHKIITTDEMSKRLRNFKASVGDTLEVGKQFM